MQSCFQTEENYRKSYVIDDEILNTTQCINIRVGTQKSEKERIWLLANPM